MLYNKDEKLSRSPGPSCKFWGEAKLNNIVYFVYTLPAVCTVQLINTWRQAGLSRGSVDYSENGGHQTDRNQTEPDRSEYRVRPGLKTK